MPNQLSIPIFFNHGDDFKRLLLAQRVLKRIRLAWPETHIVLRGDGHFSNPELMQLAIDDPLTDFIFGMTVNAVLSKIAAPSTT